MPDIRTNNTKMAVVLVVEYFTCLKHTALDKLRVCLNFILPDVSILIINLAP